MRKVLISFLFLFAGFVAFSRDFRLIDSSGNSVISCKTKNNLEISVAAGNFSSENMIRYVVTIKNNGTDDYYFDENSISVRQGNYEIDYWDYLSYYNASDYYDRIQAEKTSAIAATTAAAVISILSPDYPPLRGGRRYQPRYSATDYVVSGLFAAGASAIVISSLMNDYNMSLSHLREVLLFSKNIRAGETLSGYIMSDNGKGPDYKLNIRVSNDENAEFVFLRSDRDRILHPWRDPNYAVQSFSYGVLFPVDFFNFSLNYIYGGQPLGFYFSFEVGLGGKDTIGELGSSGRVSFHDLSYRGYNTAYFKADGKTSADFVGFKGGATWKIIPHTWLLAGLGFDFETSYKRGALFDSSSGKVIDGDAWVDANESNAYFSPQIGLNAVFNFLNFGGTFTWRVGSGDTAGPVVGAFIGFTIN